MQIIEDQIAVGNAVFPVSASPTGAELDRVVAAIVSEGGEGGAIIWGRDRAPAVAHALDRALHAQSVNSVSCEPNGANCSRLTPPTWPRPR